MNLNSNDTIVALSTGEVESAIGVIRLSGANALIIANNMFNGKDLLEQDSHTLHFGTIRDEESILDEVVVGLFKGPNSYTGENVVEISCHGSKYILQQVIDLAVKKGARLAEPGEFTLRAFLNGKLDLTQAEAVADLIASGNEAAHDLAMKQMRGGFSKQIGELRQELTDFAALLELELDFSEEDVAFADRERLVKLIDKIQSVIRPLIESFKLGNAIKEGVSTVIAGRPNAGKSTLLNALLNEERAIVSDIPGTTRDTIEESLLINGVEFRLIDTAGIREATDAIETIGVERTMEKLRSSAIFMYLFDLSELSVEQVQEDIQALRSEEVPGLIVANKSDLVMREQLDVYLEAIPDLIVISAKEGSDIQILKDKLLEKSISEDLSQGGTIVSNARHVQSLRHAQESLSEAKGGLESGLDTELVALDIRRSLDALGQITGEVTTDDVLGSIFSRFCIGK